MKSVLGVPRKLSDVQVAMVLTAHERFLNWRARSKTKSQIARELSVTVAVLNLVVVHGPNYMVHSAANPSIGRPPTVTDPHVRALILAWHTEWISLCAERQTILTLRQLAAQFGVSPGTIQALIRNQGQYKQPDPQFREANRREYYARRAALRVRGILA